MHILHKGVCPNYFLIIHWAVLPRDITEQAEDCRKKNLLHVIKPSGFGPAIRCSTKEEAELIPRHAHDDEIEQDQHHQYRNYLHQHNDSSDQFSRPATTKITKNRTAWEAARDVSLISLVNQCVQ